MLDDFQVQLAHAADQRLAGLFVLVRAERRILPLHHLQHVGQLLALGRVSGSIAIEMTVSGNSIVSSRIGSAASHSVSPVIECRRPMMPTMSPASTLVDLLAAVGLDVPQLGDVFLLVLAGIERPAVGLELAGVDAHVVQVAVLVGVDLEHQPAKRLVERRLARQLASSCFLGSMPSTGGMSAGLGR